MLCQWVAFCNKLLLCLVLEVQPSINALHLAMPEYMSLSPRVDCCCWWRCPSCFSGMHTQSCCIRLGDRGFHITSYGYLNCGRFYHFEGLHIEFSYMGLPKLASTYSSLLWCKIHLPYRHRLDFSGNRVCLELPRNLGCTWQCSLSTQFLLHHREWS